MESLLLPPGPDAHSTLYVPPRVESLFPPVLSKSCNQIPLWLKAWFSGNSFSLCQTSMLGSLTCGSEPSLQWVDFCGIIVLQFVSLPHSGYGIWLYCDCVPPTVLLQLVLCLWMWGIFFGEFQCLPVDDCSAVSCDSGALASGSESTSFYSAILINLLCWFLLGGPFYWHIIVCNNPLWSFVFLFSVVTFPFSFKNLLIQALSLLFLIRLAKGWPIFFIFSKNQLLVSLIFSLAFFLYFIYFCSPLYDYLPSTNFGFCLFFFSISFRCKVRLLIWDFSCFLR